MADLVAAVPDDALAASSSCARYTVGDLLDHIGGFALAFQAAAVKQPLPGAPSGDASCLDRDWRWRIPADLLALAEAWRQPEAWAGTTAAGGVELPGAVAGVVALDELVIHGWDLATATGQPAAEEPASTPSSRCRRRPVGPIVYGLVRRTPFVVARSPPETTSATTPPTPRELEPRPFPPVLLAVLPALRV